MIPHRLAQFIAGALLAVTAVHLAADGRPADFEATFELVRNDKLAGESTATFNGAGAHWSLSSKSEGTRGLARFLGLEEHTVSEGTWLDGAPRPDRYDQSVKVAVKTVETRARFDWDAGTVVSTHKDGEDTLPLTAGTLDPGTIALRIRTGLIAGEREWTLDVVDEDKIESQRFVAHAPERLDTALGCIETVRVDRDRGPESTRYTRTWYATAHGFAPVRATHGKKDGDHIETRITQLKVAGQSVAAGAAC
ncbi:DUF3108 domain-containing protein [Marinihelvus fidelis]|uniref:DUF3108 domain-containing protein n=1 Tax=Marinihelvus fidelis TaxID=2613842 RepID=UPI00177B3621|nr:DUF3108 domain-containing protein [Marinihelvus fidelis]